MGIDYGTKRIGIAVTDPLQIIATALTTIPTATAVDYIKKYAAGEVLEGIVIGIPRHLNNEYADIVPTIEKFIAMLEKELPGITIYRADERFTSKIATRSLLESGQSRKTRRDKSVVDRVSATLILQSWLEQKEK
jgi:putative holliday junction resolvase